MNDMTSNQPSQPVKPDTDELIEVVQSVEEASGTMKEEIEAIKRDVSGIKEALENRAATIDEHNEAIKTLNQMVDSIGTRLKDVEQSINEIEPAIERNMVEIREGLKVLDGVTEYRNQSEELFRSIVTQQDQTQRVLERQQVQAKELTNHVKSNTQGLIYLRRRLFGEGRTDDEPPSIFAMVTGLQNAVEQQAKNMNLMKAAVIIIASSGGVDLGREIIRMLG